MPLGNKILTMLLVLVCSIILSARNITLTSRTTDKELKCARKVLVKSDVDLNGRSIRLAKNSALVFEKGAITNGTIQLSRTRLEGEVRLLCKVAGTVKNKTIYANWFVKDNDLDEWMLSGALSLGGVEEIHFAPSSYVLSVRNKANGISVSDMLIDGEGCRITAKQGGRMVYSLLPFSECKNVEIKNFHYAVQKKKGQRHSRGIIWSYPRVKE